MFPSFLKAGIATTILAAAVAASVFVATAATGDRQANNPQVASSPSSNTTAVFPTNKQNETTIAINPVDSQRLIAGSNDEQAQPPCGPGPLRGATAAANDCSFFPDVGTSGVYTSSDGGDSWVNRGLLPGYTDGGSNGTLVSDGDPVIVYGPKPGPGGTFTYANGARAYYATLAGYRGGAANGNQVPELIAVSVSDDDGATWSNPVVVANANGKVFNDKESIWVDNNPASPYFGRAYVSWSQFRSGPGTTNAIRVAHSTDGGATWSGQTQVSPAYNNGNRGGRQYSALRSGPDGTVYMAWEDGDQKVGSRQVISVSRDGGVSWSKRTSIAVADDIGDPIPGSNFRTASYPSIAVDRASGAVWVAWADEMGGATGVILVARSTDRGATWTQPRAVSRASDGYAFFQGLDVAPNGRIDVAYQSQTATSLTSFGTGNARIENYYVSSADGGATWSAPRKVSEAPSDPAASAQNNLERQFWGDYSTLVSTNANVFFIATDARNGVGCLAVDAFQVAFIADPASAVKPAPGALCASQFGNSDAYVAKIAP